MALYSRGSQIKSVVVFDPNASVGHELKTLVGPIQIYEDVADPSMHINVTIFDTFGKKESIPIRSGSRCQLLIEHPTGNVDFINYPLFITNIINTGSTEKKEFFTLELETGGIIYNNLQRLVQKYDDKADKLIKKFLGTIGVPDDRISEDFETPKYPIQFMGNYKRPLNTCVWLASHSIPAIEGDTGTDTSNSGSGGFFFWETLTGYFFKSVDNIFRKAIDAKDQIEKYFQSSTMDALDERSNYRIASRPSWSKDHALLDKLSKGQYASFHTFIDVLDEAHTVAVRDPSSKHEFKPKSQIESGDSKGAVLANEVTHNPLEFLSESRYRCDIIDTRTFDEGEKYDKDNITDGKTNQEQVKYRARIHSRYAALFSEVLTITVPLNLRLQAGTVIEVEFPRINIDKPNSGNVNPASGFYMIKSLSHQFLSEGDFTGLKLVRDSYSETK